jgi:membrane-associated protein
MLNTIINHLLIFSGWSALALVFTLPALESSIFLGFVLPGETAVVVGGFLAYEHRVSFPAVLAAGILGAIIGDSVGFWVGERWGDALLGRLPKKLIKPEHVTQGKAMIKRLGGRAVFAGRWVSVLRALVPGLCGTSRMPYRTFLLWNAIGGVTWAVGYTLLGYLAGSAWQRVEHYTSVVSYALLGAIVVAIVGLILFNRRRQHKRDAETLREMSAEGGDEVAAAGSAEPDVEVEVEERPAARQDEEQGEPRVEPRAAEPSTSAEG